MTVLGTHKSRPVYPDGFTIITLLLRAGILFLADRSGDEKARFRRLGGFFVELECRESQDERTRVCRE